MIGQIYKKGDYVFAKATSGNHHSMFIAENNFKAQKVPSEDLDNWIEFQAPRGEKGKDGATGSDGPRGDKGEQGATGSDGPKGDKGDPGKDGKDGTGASDELIASEVAKYLKEHAKEFVGATGENGKKGDDGDDGSDWNDDDWELATDKYVSNLPVNSSVYQYKFYKKSQGWIKSPKTNKVWSWGNYFTVPGIWKYKIHGNMGVKEFECAKELQAKLVIMVLVVQEATEKFKSNTY